MQADHGFLNVLGGYVRSVDSYVASLPPPREIAFVKIDVQGYELPVVQGMAQTLAANERIVVAFEYAPFAMVDLGFDPEALLAAFRDHGWRLHRLDKRGGLRALAGDDVLGGSPYVDLVCSRRRGDDDREAS